MVQDEITPLLINANRTQLLKASAKYHTHIFNIVLCRDLMEELLPLLREAVDRKQENMRRRRRRDALRLHLNKMLLLIAQKKTFANRWVPNNER